MIACCRDESDIIRPFIDFYLAQGFDRICLVDNGSRDDTLAQIRAHPDRGRVEIHADPRPGYDVRLIEYHDRFVGFASRWVFFVDVDEFIVVPGGIKRFAVEVPAEVTVLELRTAEMIPVIAPPSAPALLATRRLAGPLVETKLVWKAGVATKIYCGKHAIAGHPIVRHRADRLFMRHFHTRSESQFRQKLKNRIDTETAISAMPGVADDLSAFSIAERVAWIEESRAFLKADGWELEKARLAAMPSVEDVAIRDWYCDRYGMPQ